jgi:hypothetical protein
MAIGVKYKCTVGEVESKYKSEVCQLIEEMANAVEIVRYYKIIYQIATHYYVINCYITRSKK